LSGERDNLERGYPGVRVRAYNANGVAVGQTLSSNNGDYTITGLNNGETYQITFGLTGDSFLSSSGSMNGDVHRVTVPLCDADLALVQSHTTCTADTEVFLTCFVNGLNGNNPGQETIVGLTYSFNGGSAVKSYANQSETGSIWGLEYSSSREAIYTASFVKQHSALTGAGHDVIYKTDISGNPTTTVFADLSNLGENTGTLNQTDVLNCEYGLQVGKFGLGALVMDHIESSIFVVNLYNKSVVKLDADNPTSGTTTSFAVPNPGCSNNDYVPFALKMYDGKLWVGVTCTGETSQNEDDTSIHVYSMNVDDGTYNLEFSSDYSRGVWKDQIGYKQTSQWLTDIDFTDDGNMVIALGDRIGNTYCDNNSSRLDDQFGDVLLVGTDINGNWILENNGSVGSLSGSGVSNSQGPGGGEFFGDDYFPGNRNDHPDVALGSIYVMPGTNSVVAAVFDPVFDTYSGGVHRYSTTNGSKQAGQQLYNRNIQQYFGKSTGFGDIDARCERITSSIGNLVWIDENCNGLQEASESGVANVEVNLYNKYCGLIRTTTTDAQGRYKFTGLNENSTYYVQLGSSVYDENVMSYLYNLVYYNPTTILDNDQTNSDIVYVEDHCAAANGPVVEVNTISGFNANFDIGIKEATDFDLALDKKLVGPSGVRSGEDVEFEITVYNQGGVLSTGTSIVDYLTPAFSFNQAKNPGWTVNGTTLRYLIDEFIAPGQSKSVSLVLELNASDDYNDYTNYAEIRSSFTSLGVLDDIDSQSDDNPDNDKGGNPDSSTDNLITDNGTLDEDDHDPAKVKVLDLALVNKVLNNGHFDLGDVATFEMTVCNQGNVPVTSFDISNKFPGELIFEEGLNPGWRISNLNLATMTSDEVLNPGDKISYTLNLKIGEHGEYLDIIDLAEISSITGDCPETISDFDSTPDSNFNNDKGGDPYDGTDNIITDNGTVDEDDHDPAVVSVRRIDLALTKTTNTMVHNPGDVVEFLIDIYNQGEVSMRSVMLVDYLPDFTIRFCRWIWTW